MSTNEFQRLHDNFLHILTAPALAALPQLDPDTDAPHVTAQVIFSLDGATGAAMHNDHKGIAKHIDRLHTTHAAYASHIAGHVYGLRLRTLLGIDFLDPAGARLFAHAVPFARLLDESPTNPAADRVVGAARAVVTAALTGTTPSTSPMVEPVTVLADDPDLSRRTFTMITRWYGQRLVLNREMAENVIRTYHHECACD